MQMLGIFSRHILERVGGKVGYAAPPCNRRDLGMRVICRQSQGPGDADSLICAIVRLQRN